MRVRVLDKPYYYNRRMWAVGEELDVDDREDGNVDILAKMGQLEVVTPTSRSGSGYKTAAMKAQPAAQPEQSASEQAEDDAAPEPMTTENAEALADHPNRRVYRRRDMKPQE